jgi:hypothetical protein
MPRPPLRVLAVVAVTALGGVAQAGCGSDDGGLLPRARATELQADLDAVQAALEAGRCEEARRALSEVRGDLVNLPDSVDEDLRARLQAGVDNLDQRVTERCGSNAQPEADPDAQPEETAPQDTGEETTPPEETDTGEETSPPEETDTGEETTPPDTSTDEQPAPEEPAPGAGGTGGVSPGGDGG